IEQLHPLRDELHGESARLFAGGLSPHAVGDEKEPVLRVNVTVVFVVIPEISRDAQTARAKLHGDLSLGPTWPNDIGGATQSSEVQLNFTPVSGWGKGFVPNPGCRPSWHRSRVLPLRTPLRRRRLDSILPPGGRPAPSTAETATHTHGWPAI